MKQLKNRLYTISTLVPKGARVADIGCDHGHLPIYLVQQGVSPFCVASDIKEKPLESARANIQKVGLNIDTRLGAGLSTISPDEIDCITIAGMGGEVIASILENAPWVKDGKYTLILQPMTSADALRKYLCESGFKILSEVACEENNKIYTVLKVLYSGVCFTPNDVFCRVGELSPQDTTARKYIEKQLRIVGECINDLEAAKMDAEHLKHTEREIKNTLGEK